MLRPLDVIWIHDDLIRPPGPKMVVCICPGLGLFVRINTAGWRPGSVPLARSEHPFLAHDSHVECGAPFELDDYVVEQSVRRAGRPRGRISPRLIPALQAAIRAAPTIREDDKQAMLDSLEALRPP